MFASVSTHCDELGPVLEAHLYTVCPTAIPTLSMTPPDKDENALMESLGMIKDKNGEFESFDKFLHRTEVCYLAYLCSCCYYLFYDANCTLLHHLIYPGTNFYYGQYHVVPPIGSQPPRRTQRCPHMARTLYGPFTPTSHCPTSTINSSRSCGISNWSRTYARQQIPH